MTDQPPAGSPPLEAVLLQMIGGCTITQLVYVAAKLGIADRLHDGPKTVDQLATEVGAQPESLYRVLRALTVLAIFAETEGRTFAVTPLGALLQTAAPQSLRGTAIVHREELYRTWEGLLHNVQTGQPAFEHVYGMGWWDYLGQRPETAAVFNQRMTSLFTQRNAAVAAAYDFSPFRTIVDVAGGHGSLLAAILNAHPTGRGVLFDLPQVAEGARALLKQAGVAERCEVVGGDMLVAVPGGGDAYLLSTIIHDWNDEQAVAILRNCRRAMGSQGRLLVVARLVPPFNEPLPAKIMDVGMMVMMHGRERTEADCRELYRAAGFTLTQVVPTSSPYSILEGRPA